MATNKHKFIFIIVMLCVTLGVIWPIYPLFSGAYPLIMGFPLSFVWIILCLILSFSAMIWFYFVDKSPEDLD